MGVAVSSTCRLRVGEGKSLVTPIWWPPRPGHPGRPGQARSRLIISRPPPAKKRSSSPDPQQRSQQSPESTAPRVEPNSLISVRKQIRYVKALKEIERKSAFRAPKKERTKESYRKETLSEEERYQQKMRREHEEMELSKAESKSFGLRNLYGTYQVGMNARKNVLRATRAPPVLVVDGYNVLFTWERTKELMNSQEEGALEEAREILVSSLEGYSIMNGVRVIVAFDALGGDSNGITTETILEPSGISVVYTAECEADTWIVGKAKSLVEKGARTIAVVTNDATLAVAIHSPEGPQVCFAVPSSGLIADLAKTEKRAQAGFNSGAPVLALMESAVKTKDADRASDTFDKLQALRQDLLGKRS